MDIPNPIEAYLIINLTILECKLKKSFIVFACTINNKSNHIGM